MSLREYIHLDDSDKELIEAATEVIRRNYNVDKHSVGAAVRCTSGKIYVGVNIDSCGFGPCAEPIALGAAISAGERTFLSIVAVDGADNSVIAPCGNCRQMLLDFAPDAMVIINAKGNLVKSPAEELLPNAYLSFK